ncbi:MAG: SDR family NAD(P)-dependent oxidoreductase, partial [Candidatus Izemoplasmatales bacterium]|nr:SDR family NAD(P)-dependent oxidoreductase [Candidatus Izemoplasmatales bacterium]
MKAFGKTMIVTGAGGGIGRQLVLQLLAKGAKVAALDVNQERLDETAKIANKPDDLAVFICDISKKDMVDATVKEILAKFGTIDGLINNAGIIQPFIDLKDLDYKKIQLVMNVNFYGPLH